MANPDPPAARGSAPWDAKRASTGTHRFTRWLPWLAGLALVAFIGWGLWPKPIVVETGDVHRAALTVSVSEEGKTRVRNRYVVAAPVSGTMRRVALKPGDPVEANTTVLTTIEPVAVPLLDARARAQAEAVVAMQEAARSKANAALAAARSGLQLAEAERARVHAVKGEGTLSQSDRERVEAEALTKAAEVRAAEFGVQVVEYELAQARAALERPAAVLSNNLLEVKSPVSGRVLKVQQESATVIAAGTPILEVGDPTDIEIEAEILSRDAVAMRPGDAVLIDQWGGDEPLHGRVRRVEPAAFTKVSALGVEEQRVIVLSDLVDTQPVAKPLGDRYRVEVRVAVWQAPDVLVVPAGALFREGNQWKTFVYQNGRARLTAVDAGHSDGRLTEVLGGLTAGDEVLLHPPDTVADGSRVKRR